MLLTIPVIYRVHGLSPSGQRTSLLIAKRHARPLCARLLKAAKTRPLLTQDFAHYRVVSGGQGRTIALADTRARRVLLLNRHTATRLVALLSNP